MRAPRAFAATLAGILIALAGCSGSDSGAEGGGGSTSGGLEKTDLTVGVLPLADYAAAYWANEFGFFKNAGLNVTLQPISGGPAGIQAAASGEVDCSFANTIATTVAQSRGVPIEMVVLSSALGDQSNIVVVRDDSPIRSLQDLDGKKIAVNTTNNIGDVAFNNLVRHHGLNVKAQFVEVPFGEMIDGVKAGSIDAAHTPEPFRSAALAAGLREVADLTEGPNEDFPAAAFVCSRQFVNDNPNTTAAFANALYAAGEDIAKKEAEFRQWLPGVSQVPAEVAQNMKLPTYFTKPEPGQVQRLVDLLREQGVLQGSYDVSENFYQP